VSGAPGRALALAIRHLEIFYSGEAPARLADICAGPGIP